jgi:plastocyanin
VNGYDDERNKSTANVTIANGKVYPDSLLVTKGTKIVFVNNTSGSFTLDGGLVGASGFFTTTSTISTGGSTSFTFNQAGYFPYTLVSGGETLNGKILVQ